MENTKKIKLFIGLSYLLIVCLFLYFFFSKFSLSEITSYDFIKNNSAYFAELKNSNLFLISIIFLVLTVVWCFPLLGFGSPIALIGGFIFGKWIGTLLVVIGLSIGAPILNPITTSKVPIHLPNINPPIKAIGLPKPSSGKHQTTVSTKKIIEIKNKLEFLSSAK